MPAAEMLTLSEPVPNFPMVAEVVQGVDVRTGMREQKHRITRPRNQFILGATHAYWVVVDVPVRTRRKPDLKRCLSSPCPTRHTDKVIDRKIEDGTGVR